MLSTSQQRPEYFPHMWAVFPAAILSLEVNLGLDESLDRSHLYLRRVDESRTEEVLVVNSRDYCLPCGFRVGVLFNTYGRRECG